MKDNVEPENVTDYALSACDGKQKFDRATANRVVRETKKAVLTSYRCKHCGHWDIGRPKPKNEKGRR